MKNEMKRSACDGVSVAWKVLERMTGNQVGVWMTCCGASAVVLAFNYLDEMGQLDEIADLMDDGPILVAIRWHPLA